MFTSPATNAQPNRADCPVQMRASALLRLRLCRRSSTCFVQGREKVGEEMCGRLGDSELVERQHEGMHKVRVNH